MSSLKANPVPYLSAGPLRYIHELQTCSPRRFVCPSDLTDRFDSIASIRKIKTDLNHLIAQYATKQVHGRPAFTEAAEEAAGDRGQTDAHRQEYSFYGLPQRKFCTMGTISRSAYFPMEKLGLETVPPTRKGNDNRPSFTVAPDSRATILVKKPCLARIIATPG
jgi:hypothetical protein